MQQREPRLRDRLQFRSRKRGRAVEGTGLENRRRGNPFVSSNLTASARFCLRYPFAAWPQAIQIPHKRIVLVEVWLRSVSRSGSRRTNTVNHRVIDQMLRDRLWACEHAEHQRKDVSVPRRHRLGQEPAAR